MDNGKLEGGSMIGILDPTCVIEASHTINLRKDLEMYKDMTMKEFNKEVDRMTKDTRAQVSLYIAKGIHAFVQEGKKTIKIPYFLSKFHLSLQFSIEI
jgi:hypothetical protein